MTLKGYYANLPMSSHPKSEFVRKIAQRCEVSEMSVRNWIAGRLQPLNPDHRIVLSEETGIPVDELFN